MPFKKGQSGNPGGRPRALVDVQAAAREHSAAAVATLAEIAADVTAPPAARISASVAILDRAFGRPMQAVDARVGVTLEELVAASMRPTVIEGEGES